MNRTPTDAQQIKRRLRDDSILRLEQLLQQGYDDRSGELSGHVGWRWCGCGRVQVRIGEPDACRAGAPCHPQLLAASCLESDAQEGRSCPA